MIVGTFGLPGCGKTTLATKKARKINRQIMRDVKRVEQGKKRKCKYDAVLTNFECKGCYKIDFTDIGTRDIQNCAIILDEITVDADNRDFKNFKKSSVEGFVYHRHYNNDIFYYTQQWDAVDKKIRNLTQVLFYARKSYLFPFNLFTRTKQIFRTIAINDFTKEIITGYRFPNFFEFILSLFGCIRLGEICFRPLYYNDFDSFCKPLNLSKFEFEEW